jgi:hypothetical protein
VTQPIPLVDVKAQYAPLIPELERRFSAVLESGRFILGPEVEAFEREAAALLGVPHAIGVANGTDALVLSLEALGIERGDEVVCPAFTFYATSEAIARVGATPVFADIERGRSSQSTSSGARRRWPSSARSGCRSSRMPHRRSAPTALHRPVSAPRSASSPRRTSSPSATAVS